MRRHLWVFLVPLSALIALALAAADGPYTPAPAAAKEAAPDPALLRLRAKLNPEFPRWSAAYVMERCAEHLATVNAYDRKYVRYFDLSDLTRALLVKGTAALFFGANSAARCAVTQVPRAVPNSDNRVFWVDLRWYNWTPEVWEVISEQDPYFREPLVPSDSPGLNYLRQETHANAVVRADWLLYYTYDNSEFLKLGETFDEKAFYYLLVYACVEFHREVTEAKEVEEEYTADEVKKVQYTDGYRTWYQDVTQPITKKRKRKVVKKTWRLVRGVGPKNAREFQEAWKVDFNVLKDFPIDMGTMIARGKSGVSYENRVLWRLRTAVGIYWRTFDVLRSVGDQDFVETPFPKKFDAGEHIVRDDRGAQFYHLSNGLDDSVDFGDPRVVKDNVSGARVLTTAGSCVHCHDLGILGFANEHRRLADIGAELRAYDHNRADRFAQFYLQTRKMAAAVKDDQRDYAQFVLDCNGLTPAENATGFGEFRAWYKKDVDLAQAAREHGADPKELSDAIGYQGTKGRLGALVLDGTPVPRLSWERGDYAESGLLLREWRKQRKMLKNGYPGR
jgi:hypothetical protein